MKLNQIVTNVVLAAGLSIATFFGASSVAQADTTYIVQSGDTLSEILVKINEANNTNIHDVAATNNIKDVNLIFPGQKIVIKVDKTATTTKPVQQATTTTTPAKTVQQPVQQPVVKQQPVQQTVAKPVVKQQTTPTVRQTAPSAPAVSQTTSSEAAAKAWIANKESGGSYTARNGRYIGKYQLTDSYLHGDYSPANQERVANSYVSSRYGSWVNAKNFWLANGWY